MVQLVDFIILPPSLVPTQEVAKNQTIELSLTPSLDFVHHQHLPTIQGITAHAGQESIDIRYLLLIWI